MSAFSCHIFTRSIGIDFDKFCRKKIRIMKLTNIDSQSELMEKIKDKQRAFVLIYKSGADSSECALKGIRDSRKEETDFELFLVDVNKVKDVHTLYGINSAPSLLEFENGRFRNVVKGCNNPGFYNAFFENLQIYAAGTPEKPQPQVTVYSTPTCSWCNTLKSYFRKNHIRFTDMDVSRDQNAAAEMVRLSGQQGVPQTVINGQVIVGFDKTRINNLLGINGNTL